MLCLQAYRDLRWSSIRSPVDMLQESLHIEGVLRCHLSYGLKKGVTTDALSSLLAMLLKDELSVRILLHYIQDFPVLGYHLHTIPFSP
jgi:hypothetical protein